MGDDHHHPAELSIVERRARALEAAVIAGLVSAGMADTAAVPAVFLFRIATFWLPILPGWIAFNHLRRQDYV